MTLYCNSLKLKLLQRLKYYFPSINAVSKIRMKVYDRIMATLGKMCLQQALILKRSSRLATIEWRHLRGIRKQFRIKHCRFYFPLEQQGLFERPFIFNLHFMMMTVLMSLTPTTILRLKKWWICRYIVWTDTESRWVLWASSCPNKIIEVTENSTAHSYLIKVRLTLTAHTNQLVPLRWSSRLTNEKFSTFGLFLVTSSKLFVSKFRNTTLVNLSKITLMESWPKPG